MSLRSRQHSTPLIPTHVRPEDRFSASRNGPTSRSLLGLYEQPSSRGGGGGGEGGGYGADAMLLEQANDRQVEELQTRVGAIRHITLEIEAELQNSNRLLDEMNFSLDSTRALLETAMKRLERVTAAAGSRHMVYLFMFCFFVFMLLYYIIR